VPVYSHSRLSSFENCPLQYRYRYIDKIKREVEGIEAFVGKLAHEVLEALYSDLDRARRAGAGEYKEMFRGLWRARLTPKVRIVREEMTPEHYSALGERCVETYYNRHHPFDSGEVLGCETRVEFALDGQGRYKILGFIDRIDRVAPGVYEVHDYKTGSLPRAGALKKDRQLTLYEIAVRERFTGVTEVHQVWHFLAHDKKFVERRTQDDLVKTRLSAIRSIQNIEATAEFPPRRSALCSWCEYKEICPEWEAERQAAAPRAQAQQTVPAPDMPPDIPPDMEPSSGQFLLFGKSSP
jgi:putative RecB family exonuclease